jgi:hypothetical protein
MINREDLVFATCYQLAELISSDWDDPPEEVKTAIGNLSDIDEPGESFHNTGGAGKFLKLTPSEKEPESIRKTNRFIELKIAISNFKKIIHHSDGWNTSDSDTIKKEIIARINDYDSEAKAIVTPVPDICNIVV